MSRTKKFLYNSISTGFYQVIVMLAGFITPRFMLKYYGSEVNGLVSSINQFIVYFNLVEAGLSGAAIYALYKPLADNNYKGINSIVSATRKFYTQSGYIFLSLTIGLAAIYPLLVKTNAVTPLNVGLLVLILGVNGALEFFTLAKYRVLLTADQRTYVVSLASIVHIVINTVIIVFLARLEVNIVVLRLVALTSIFLRSAILMIYVRIKYRFLDYKEKPDYSALSKRWDALYLQILGTIHSGAPVVILTFVAKNLKVVSVYTIFNMIIAGINGILSIFISGLSASFGDVIAKGEQRILQKAYEEFELFYYMLITIVYATAFIMIMPFIQIYTSGITDINYNLPLVGFLFVLNGLLFNIKTPQGMLVISAGLFKETKIQTTIQGAIVIIVGILLGPYMGVTGVLIGSILSNFYRDIELMFFIPRTVTKLSVRRTAKRILRIFTSIVLIWLPINFIQISPTGYLSWMKDAIIIVVYSSIVVLVINVLLERENTVNASKRIIGMVKR
ncbi:MAG: hypothetical protein AAGU27_25685 [Dehalobacterium sp.]